MSVHHICAWCLWGSDEGVGPSGTGITDGYELPCLCGESNQFPLEGQSVNLTAELHLQLPPASCPMPHFNSMDYKDRDPEVRGVCCWAKREADPSPARSPSRGAGLQLIRWPNSHLAAGVRVESRMSSGAARAQEEVSTSWGCCSACFLPGARREHLFLLGFYFLLISRRQG